MLLHANFLMTSQFMISSSCLHLEQKLVGRANQHHNFQVWLNCVNSAMKQKGVWSFNSQLTKNKHIIGFTWYQTLVEQMISCSQRGFNKIGTTGNRVKMFSKLNCFLSQKTEKLNFEPLLKALGAKIVWNTIRKVGLPVKMRSQPSPYYEWFWKYRFLSFFPKFSP